MGEIRHSDSTTNATTGSSPKITITFRELHNSYGRPILKDYNFWKYEQKEKVENASENLITF